jgi:arylsulfatase A-like enzyme
MRRSYLRAGLLALLAGLATAPAACWRERPAGPNVALLIFDTLRADRLGAYGYPRQTSPALDRLCRQAVLFAAAYAQASWTKPSVASVLTSLDPTAHQAIAGRAIDEGTPLSIDSLSDELLTLPTALASAGYRTGCIQTNPNIKAKYGFAQGCGDYQYLAGDNSARAVSAAASRWLEGDKPGPTFLYAHYMDPHMPYTPPHPLGEAFAGKGGSDPNDIYNVAFYRSIYNNVLNANLGLAPFQPALIPDARQLRRWKGLYDAEVAGLDEGVSSLLSTLQRGKDTWIFVIADHGEQHLEHGSMGHGQALYEELIRVPLLVYGPGAPAGRIVAEPVELIDVFPTILDLIGVQDRFHGLQGRSFAAALRERPGAAGRVARRAIFAEVDDSHAVRARPLRMLLSGRLKLIDNEFRGDRELYDLDRDPAERHALDPNATPEVQEMLEELETIRTRDRQRAAELPTPRRVPMDSETLRQLKSLNYIQ